jgi:hypothetical protein
VLLLAVGAGDVLPSSRVLSKPCAINMCAINMCAINMCAINMCAINVCAVKAGVTLEVAARSRGSGIFLHGNDSHRKSTSVFGREFHRGVT